MNCHLCKKQNEPWLILRNDYLYTDDDNKPIGKTLQFCSYLCSKKYTKTVSNYGNLIINKDDFKSYYLCPLIQKREEKEFEYLTIEEIQKLSDEKKQDYYSEREKIGYFNSEKDMIYKELEMEEINTYLIENKEDYSSDSEFDDY